MQTVKPSPKLIFYIRPAQPGGYVAEVERFGPRRRRLVEKLDIGDEDDRDALIARLCAKHRASGHEVVDLPADLPVMAGPARPSAPSPPAAFPAAARQYWPGLRRSAILCGILAMAGIVSGLILAGRTSGPPVVAQPAGPEIPPGLGITRGEMVRSLTLLDYQIRPEKDLAGLPRWVATSPFGMAEMIGPEQDLRRITLLLQDAQNAEMRQRVVTEMSAMIESAFPRWDGHSAWVASALAAGEGSVVRDRKEAHLSRLQGVGLMLSIGRQ